jgi:endonuclease/exonuclease/phosphatase family metal-dependent hydrolase
MDTVCFPRCIFQHTARVAHTITTRTHTCVLDIALLQYDPIHVLISTHFTPSHLQINRNPCTYGHSGIHSRSYIGHKYLAGPKPSFDYSTSICGLLSPSTGFTLDEHGFFAHLVDSNLIRHVKISKPFFFSNTVFCIYHLRPLIPRSYCLIQVDTSYHLFLLLALDDASLSRHPSSPLDGSGSELGADAYTSGRLFEVAVIVSVDAEGKCINARTSITHTCTCLPRKYLIRTFILIYTAELDACCSSALLVHSVRINNCFQTLIHYVGTWSLSGLRTPTLVSQEIFFARLKSLGKENIMIDNSHIYNYKSSNSNNNNDNNHTNNMGSQFVDMEAKVKPALTVLTVNLWNFNHWGLRQTLLADQLLALNADVIGVQEVRVRRSGSKKENQAETLFHALPGYQFVYQPAMGFEEWAENNAFHQEGIAVFSRHPIASVKPIFLSRDEKDSGDFHQRLCLQVEILSPVGPVWFLVTHLSLSEKARARSLSEIGAVVEALSGPVVLVGDFNTVLDGGNVLERVYGLSDAWVATHPRPVRVTPKPHGGESEVCGVGPEQEFTALLTAWEREGWTFQAWDPRSRIDYIFTRGLQVVAATVEGKAGTTVKGLAPVGGVEDARDTLFVSDHWFVRAVMVV